MAASAPNRFAWLRRSSTLRLSLLLSALFAVSFVVALLLALRFGEEALLRRVDATLLSIAGATTAEDASVDDDMVILQPLDDAEDMPLAFQRAIRRGGGTVHFDDEYRDAHTWRVLVTEDNEDEPVIVAIPLDDSEEALELVAGALWTTAIIVVGLAVATGLGAGLLAQRRLARINRTLMDLAKGDLSARTGTTRSRDDLDDIARQLDRTAAELETLVSQTRNLSASLAHDLRTPLARLTSRLEMLPESPERNGALSEAERLSEVFSTIMRVARIEATQGTEGFAEVALQPLVEELGEIFGPVVEDAGKSLTMESNGQGTVFGDRHMLVQAMANLIQNALVHGGDRITLFATAHALGVRDNGPGVDDSAFAEIVKPMVRLDASRASEGLGLGLALVRAVADRHGAELVLTGVKPQGLSVALNFAKK